MRGPLDPPRSSRGFAGGFGRRLGSIDHAAHRLFPQLRDHRGEVRMAGPLEPALGPVHQLMPCHLNGLGHDCEDKPRLNVLEGW